MPVSKSRRESKSDSKRPSPLMTNLTKSSIRRREPRWLVEPWSVTELVP